MPEPAPSQHTLVNQLAQSEHLQQVPPEQLGWLASQGAVRRLRAGEHLFEKGDPIQQLIVVLEGTLQFRLEQKGEYRTISELQAGDISGALPYSRATNAIASGLARDKAAVLLLNKSHFQEMVRTYPELTEALVHVMTSRVREFTHTQQQTEKLAALGRLSAGLHHELNNPAAAAARAADELREQLRLVPEKFRDLMLIQLSPEQAQAITSLLFSKLERKGSRSLSLLERSAQEDELAEWLEGLGLEDPFALAETFSSHQIGLEELQQLSQQTGQDRTAAVLVWLSSILLSNKLVSEIIESTRRISSLVGAVKGYSHMDRSPERERTDLEASIRNTLIMLNHKLKKKQIELKLDAPPELPHPCVYGGELNQVWTNLIDNALDAMEPGGTLSIQLKEKEEALEIAISDTGSGIPQEALSRVFDPFYTTKSVGEGSGIGLDISKKIIERHGGTISVQSAPGQTTFTILLPLNPAS
ncbi:sensor histidine kinase [Cesiribacter andamanensis]|uniref:histidine kinase n=1 Tax=Cesiribacter andamanensis AMV16 TaxID=1279009 RepID=M7NLQ8_9BACT|nr:ATP-binding protein [Cesiribacter andamanensis]EMR02710.1 Sensor protein ZraS [Cesiribacter andamanensis AMV16]